MAALFNSAAPTLQPTEILDIGYSGVGLKRIEGSIMDLLMLDTRTAKKNGSNLRCNFFDTEVVLNIAELLLHGVAIACLDSFADNLCMTTFSTAFDVKMDMVVYLMDNTRTSFSESATNDSDGDLTKTDAKPSKFIQDLIDCFVRRRRYLEGRVSELPSVSRLSEVEKCMQKMAIDKFWSLHKREAIAKILLRNVDMKCSFHCGERFDMAAKLFEHRSRCKFRVVRCTNDGCRASFSAVLADKHGSLCPFRVIPCEKMCQKLVIRSEMDRHCATVCPMKLVNCPFHHDGCEAAFPQGKLSEHTSQCKFRPVNCTNVGCTSSFPAIRVDKHDPVCPFKPIPCKLMCQQRIIRHEMESHCATVCPMKLVECPFHSNGCEAAFPQGAPEKLSEHKSKCKFYPVICINIGCTASFPAVHVDKHDSVCPFKILPCKQLCQQGIMRREMDRHCTTVCPMKHMKCPFYCVGCRTALTECNVEEHCSEATQSHLYDVLQVITRQDSSIRDLSHRVLFLEEANRVSEITINMQEEQIRTLEQQLQEQSLNTTSCKNQQEQINRLERLVHTLSLNTASCKTQEGDSSKIEHEFN